MENDLEYQNFCPIKYDNCYDNSNCKDCKYYIEFLMELEKRKEEGNL